jgi:hypothetical protein
MHTGERVITVEEMIHGGAVPEQYQSSTINDWALCLWASALARHVNPNKTPLTYREMRISCFRLAMQVNPLCAIGRRTKWLPWEALDSTKGNNSRLQSILAVHQDCRYRAIAGSVALFHAAPFFAPHFYVCLTAPVVFAPHFYVYSNCSCSFLRLSAFTDASVQSPGDHLLGNTTAMVQISLITVLMSLQCTPNVQ